MFLHIQGTNFHPLFDLPLFLALFFVMAIHHRKLLEEIYSYGQFEVKEATTRPFEDCPESCSDHDKKLVPPVVTHKSTIHHHIPTTFAVILCIVGGAFLLLCCFMILRRRSNRTRVRNPTLNNPVGEDFIDENQGPVLDHPIWYINTVGLQQSVIDSIAVFRYKEDERLIEGSDCSVCLSEFQEDESLRLLPKCSHAFHVSCIDTWLRSHKNCPLCRAPIVSDANNASNESGPREETQRVNIENDSGAVGQQIREDGNDEISVIPIENASSQPVQDERVAKILESNLLITNSRIGEGRVLRDLASHEVTIEDESQPVRRSFSVDLSSASLVHLAVANSKAAQNDGCSSTQVQVQEKILKFMAKQGKQNSNSNSSMDGWIASASFRRSLRKKPITMKRSFSCSGNCFVPGTIITSPDSISHL